MAVVASLRGGKRIGGAVYVHGSALSEQAFAVVEAAAAIAEIPTERGSVCKFLEAAPVVSLLHYPGFFTEGFPTLQAAWTVDLGARTAVYRHYDAAGNPPILHRKELTLDPDHPDFARFARLTAQAEAARLFDDSAIIGHAAAWHEELASRGLAVVDHQIVAADSGPDARTWQAERHRTALSRVGLSSPVQALWRHGLLDATLTFFDYGCGRGDDVALLGDRGISASGWDPWFAADRPRTPADVVNIGFVLNVIENLTERRDALSGAWNLAGRVLSVAALIGGRTAQDRWRLYQDGVLTSRGTFQKYFSHAELGAYIAEVVGREPVAAQPGVWFVFRRDEDEQDFLAARQRSGPVRPAWERGPPRSRPARIRPERQPRVPKPGHGPKPNAWQAHADLAEALWQACLEWGRLPDASEWPDLAEVAEHLARPETALKRLLRERDPQLFDQARDRRMGDLRVYLALQLFERRRSFAHLSERLQRDVRTFWGSHGKAVDAGRALLFSAGKTEVIGMACEHAAAAGLGWLVRDGAGRVDSLHVRSAVLSELPEVLRVYVGCAERLYGDLRAADVVKVHARSAKVTAQHYDDFEGRLVPDLLERVKIDLLRADIDVFGYGTEQFPAQPLWLKSRLMAVGSEAYERQAAFDARLLAAEGLDFSGFGPGRGEVEAVVGPWEEACPTNPEESPSSLAEGGSEGA